MLPVNKLNPEYTYTEDHAVVCMNVSLVCIKQCVTRFWNSDKENSSYYSFACSLCYGQWLIFLLTRDKLPFTLNRNMIVIYSFIQSAILQQYTVVWKHLKESSDVIFTNNKKHSARFSANYCPTLAVLRLSICATVICVRHVLLEKSVIPVLRKTEFIN